MIHLKYLIPATVIVIGLPVAGILTSVAADNSLTPVLVAVNFVSLFIGTFSVTRLWLMWADDRKRGIR